MSEPNAPDFRVPEIVKSAPTSGGASVDLVNRVLEAVKIFVDRRVAKSEANLAGNLKQLEDVLERQSPADTVRRLTRMSEHLARLETRLAALERKR